MEEQSQELRNLVAEVAAAYFANSHVGVADIGAVIEQIANSLSGVGGQTDQPSISVPEDAESQKRPTPAQIRKSITPDALISFEDGRAYKTLRRHLSVKGLTPDQYRQKWGLPKDYPLVCANYSAARSQMAKQLGLGSRTATTESLPEAVPHRRRRAAMAAQK